MFLLLMLMCTALRFSVRTTIIFLFFLHNISKISYLFLNIAICDGFLNRDRAARLPPLPIRPDSHALERTTSAAEYRAPRLEAWSRGATGRFVHNCFLSV